MLVLREVAFSSQIQLGTSAFYVQRVFSNEKKKTYFPAIRIYNLWEATKRNSTNLYSQESCVLPWPITQKRHLIPSVESLLVYGSCVRPHRKSLFKLNTYICTQTCMYYMQFRQINESLWGFQLFLLYFLLLSLFTFYIYFPLSCLIKALYKFAHCTFQIICTLQFYYLVLLHIPMALVTFIFLFSNGFFC